MLQPIAVTLPIFHKNAKKLTGTT